MQSSERGFLLTNLATASVTPGETGQFSGGSSGHRKTVFPVRGFLSLAAARHFQPRQGVFSSLQTLFPWHAMGSGFLFLTTRSTTMATTRPAQMRAPETQPETDAVQRMRDEAWAQVAQAEAQDPRFLRALRDQQQDLHSRGELR